VEELVVQWVTTQEVLEAIVYLLQQLELVELVEVEPLSEVEVEMEPPTFQYQQL
jgi:hypothetical protein